MRPGLFCRLRGSEWMAAPPYAANAGVNACPDGVFGFPRLDGPRLRFSGIRDAQPVGDAHRHQIFMDKFLQQRERCLRKTLWQRKLYAVDRRVVESVKQLCGRYPPLCIRVKHLAALRHGYVKYPRYPVNVTPLSNILHGVALMGVLGVELMTLDVRIVFYVIHQQVPLENQQDALSAVVVCPAVHGNTGL